MELKPVATAQDVGVLLNHSLTMHYALLKELHHHQAPIIQVQLLTMLQPTY